MNFHIIDIQLILSRNVAFIVIIHSVHVEYLCKYFINSYLLMRETIPKRLQKDYKSEKNNFKTITIFSI